ncbi:hypothetical protein GCM10007301_14150 [Azorhizobium oxalatiphilum]|uniref:DUF2497 domain-containing protein n=1 Tax=Azorhizobium oxalatiphilum TaxID=980631 RepID=A0A917F8L4_9HYPH|nr:DUF2497 domain-containing protein [Azorhizobium oxalatiphilum]GGF55683.1 hypothetical protein GCM10007301_14150 [Azorhizobium oxalatiphilum]
MEDILASIRRIISDDDHEPVRRPAPPRQDGASRDSVTRAGAESPMRERTTSGFEPARPEYSRPAPRTEASRPGQLRPDLPRPDLHHHDAPRYDAPRPDVLRAEVPRAAAPVVAPAPVAMPRAETFRREPAEPVFGEREPLRPSDTRREIPDLDLLRAEARPSAAARPEAARAAPVEAPRLPPIPDRWQDEAASHTPVAHGASADDFDFEAGIEEALAQLEPAPAPVAQRAPVAQAVIPPRVVVEPEPVAAAPVSRDLPEVRPVRVEIPAAPRRKELLSPSVDAAVAAAFGSLGSAALPEQGRTVEDLMKEILRPMLKTWLDENLPDIVEGLVRAEIERASRGGR